MEENVALDSKKQKKFDKSIKGIKKLLKKNVEQPPKPLVLAPKDDESKGGKKRRRKERGLVYLSHIPHGFYEHEMSQYFKQFGMVTNVRVIRSPRTGRSKGFAFVEFREPAVAEIVAETMNNYLMGKRLIKAAIVPPEKQRHRAFRKHWTTTNNPAVASRSKHRKDHNAAKTDSEHLKKAKKMLTQLQAKKKKLGDLGIDYDFFTPVDVPAELLEEAQVKSENKKTKVKNEPEVKKVKKESETKKNKNDQDVKQNKNKKTLAKETEQKPKEKKVEPKQSEVKNKKDAKNSIAKQNDKQKKMQDAGVELPENFIQVGESGDDSDSSLDFDSDEYEKMLANEDSDASSGEESEDEDEDGEESEDEDGEESEDEDGNEDESEDEVSEEELPPLISIKEKKGKKPIVAAPPQPKQARPAHGQKGPTTQQLQKIGPKGQNQKKQLAAAPPPKQATPPHGQRGPKPSPQGLKAKVPQPQKPQPQAMKRKNQQPEASPKKPKFEKKDKPRNKQFKKKNKA